jgi:hypothetical protein
MTFGDLREGEAGDEHGAAEVLARGVGVESLQLVLLGKRDGMDDKIEMVPLPVECREDAVEGLETLHVAGDHEIGSERLGEGPHPLAKRLALVGERELGAMLRKDLGDPPGNRMIVRHAHDQATTAPHQSRHRHLLIVRSVARSPRVPVMNPAAAAEKAGVPTHVHE